MVRTTAARPARLSSNQPLTNRTIELDSVRRDVNNWLAEFFVAQVSASRQLDSQYARLWQTLRLVTLAGGKRLRPYLTLLSYQAYGGAAYRQQMPVAVAQELLHTSLLVHDDIIDKDYVRHGQPNVAGLFQADYVQLTDTASDSLHHATSAALLGGDLLLSAAYRVVTESQLPAAQKMVALEELSSSMFAVGGGEFLDSEAALRPFDTVAALQIADLKTAKYSFVSPLRTGARLAGTDDGQLPQLEKLGTSLGIAYQLADDLLGLFGDEAVTGKSTLSDIREAKRTYVMARALQQASVADKAWLESVLGRATVNNDEADEVCAIVRRSGAQADTIALITSYVGQALAAVNRLSINASSKQALCQLIQTATERTY